MGSFDAIFFCALCMRYFDALFLCALFMHSFYLLFSCALFMRSYCVLFSYAILCAIFMCSFYVLFLCALFMRSLYSLFLCSPFMASFALYETTTLETKIANSKQQTNHGQIHGNDHVSLETIFEILTKLGLNLVTQKFQDEKVDIKVVISI